MTLNLVCSIRNSGSIWFTQMMIRHWLWRILEQGQIRPLYCQDAKQWIVSSPELKGSGGACRIVSVPVSVFVGVVTINTWALVIVLARWPLVVPLGTLISIAQLYQKELKGWYLCYFWFNLTFLLLGYSISNWNSILLTLLINVTEDCVIRFDRRKWRLKGSFLTRQVRSRMTIILSVDITKTRLFKYIDSFTTKKKQSFQIKILIFFIFLLKHRLWVLVRTASTRRV